MTELDLGPIRERLPCEVIEEMQVEIERLRTQLAEVQAECDRRAVLLAYVAYAGQSDAPYYGDVLRALGLPHNGEGCNARNALIDGAVDLGLALIWRAKQARREG